MIMITIRFCYFLFLSIFLADILFSSIACAQEPNDTRRQLDYSTRQQEATREHKLLESALADERPILIINGKTYVIQANANDVGRALYVSIQQRQWKLAEHFLKEYITLPNFDPLLVHYAQGALARARGKYKEAEYQFVTLLNKKSDFLPARLELARVWFEDYQNGQADELFAAIASGLDTSDSNTQGIQNTISAYRAAIVARGHWHGVLNLGGLWSDNVNRTSASQTCLFMSASGVCLIDRKLPDAIVANGYEFEASASKTKSLSGHHGVYLRALGFGQGWRDNSSYNEMNANIQAGYSYRSGRQTWMLAPSLDYYALGNSALYTALGIHGQWSWLFSPHSMLQIESDWKDMDYKRQGYAANYDGTQRSISLSYFRGLNNYLSVFGGFDLTDSHAPHKANAWLAHGLRAGLSVQWPAGFSHTLFLSVRQREYGAYSALLGARRKDNEYGANVSIKFNRWDLGGFTPIFTIRHYRVNSNVDWLYQYQRNTMSLKLQRGF